MVDEKRTYIEPNCRFDDHARVVTTRTILAKEELFLDYQIYHRVDNVDKQHLHDRVELENFCI